MVSKKILKISYVGLSVLIGTSLLAGCSEDKSSHTKSANKIAQQEKNTKENFKVNMSEIKQVGNEPFSDKITEFDQSKLNISTAFRDGHMFVLWSTTSLQNSVAYVSIAKVDGDKSKWVVKDKKIEDVSLYVYGDSYSKVGNSVAVLDTNGDIEKEYKNGMILKSDAGTAVAVKEGTGATVHLANGETKTLDHFPDYIQPKYNKSVPFFNVKENSFIKHGMDEEVFDLKTNSIKVSEEGIELKYDKQQFGTLIGEYSNKYISYSNYNTKNKFVHRFIDKKDSENVIKSEFDIISSVDNSDNINVHDKTLDFTAVYKGQGVLNAYYMTLK
ncbi:hypothetical protein [Bacillus cereus]|uniref:hypothetical protein n=1 Tax=Bacillus cereus TaxID=1396 RepID=UPI00187992F8|nr:hypothetical protein [Bacillus cereus]MBE7123680.1 hypothetical protein [Bacillus cereus]